MSFLVVIDLRFFEELVENFTGSQINLKALLGMIQELRSLAGSAKHDAGLVLIIFTSYSVYICINWNCFLLFKYTFDAETEQGTKTLATGAHCAELARERFSWVTNIENSILLQNNRLLHFVRSSDAGVDLLAYNNI